MILAALFSCSRGSRSITNPTTTNSVASAVQYSMMGVLYIPKAQMFGSSAYLTYNGMQYEVNIFNSPAIVKDFINAIYSNPFMISPVQQNSSGYFYRVVFNGNIMQAACADNQNYQCPSISLQAIQGY
ncbi:MAG: hypothetical protein QE271_07015 [Bacteriovoracaceae bacterium]|nr:hypothetical protein [Bacteriovoracaceae bacterium]